MPGDSDRNGSQRRSRTHALLLLVAGLWLLLLFTCVANPWPIAAAALQPRTLPLASVSVPVTIDPVPTNTPATVATTVATTIPTITGANPTATGAAVATATGAVATTPATPVDTGGGGGGDDGYQGSGAQPTRVVLAQPTAGAGDAYGSGGFSPDAFGANGLLIAMTLSCIVSILGLVVAFVALNMLIRTGYGPFLRALLLGNRAEGQSDAGVMPAGAASSGRSGRWTSRDDDSNERGDGRNNRGGGAQRRGAPVPSRAPQRQAPPTSRSRPDWR